MTDITITQERVRRYIRRLKPGGAPGADKITPEHVKLAIDSDIIIHICNLFTYCFKYGVVPTSFNQGILIPLLKKPSLDSSVGKNYRPVILSTVLSKLIEMYSLDECKGFKYSDYQFGFIEGRSTSTAVALAHDVMAYCNYNNSSVFMCSLDTEGAFDGIPHPVLFRKTINIMPDACWRLLYRWYSNMNVRIKWDKLGKSINIQKGTRQGGLTSPFLFNVFYKELVDILFAHSGGISIYNKQFNLFCYADDLLILKACLHDAILRARYLMYCVQHLARYPTRCNVASSQRAILQGSLAQSYGKLSMFNFPCKIGAIAYLFCLRVLSFCMDKYNFKARNETKLIKNTINKITINIISAK